MIVNIKHLGKRKNSVEEIPFQLHKIPNTIEELIEETVKVCVEQYKSRQEKKQILAALSKRAIEDMAAGGTVTFGMNYGEGKPIMNEAIQSAKEAFIDGIIVIFIDGVEKEKLEDVIEVKEDTKVTFVRMTMLSGRMW